MKLNDVIADIETLEVNGDTDCDITGISYDSRRVGRGYLFAALRGEKADGHNFICDAIGKGAAAVLCERAGSECGKGGMPVFIRVVDSRQALALAARNFFGDPSRELCITGITGTNGKTTTSYIMKSILESWGKKVGLIGTIQYMIGDEIFDAPHTTPEALEFQELLYRMRAAGCTHAVSEVSSHALAQRRTDGVAFRVGIFTNLTRDHLDFHKTMEDYFRAKERLFRELLVKGGAAAINADDEYGKRLASAMKNPETGRGIVYTFGLAESSDIVARGISNSPGGLRFTIAFQGEGHDVVSPLLGLPNVYNILSAAGAAISLGIPWEVILEGIYRAGTVRGRFEKVAAGQKFLAVVDYAHTEDALERLIYTARGMTGGKVITVFGCGGDRDRGKRPRMAAVATRLSDFVIITSDNPRSEKPEDIISEITAGAVRKNYLVEVDRAEAIKKGVMLANDEDILLIAGKGHETYQELGKQRVRFNDREVLKEAIQQLIARQ